MTSAQVWFNEHPATESGYPLSGGVIGTPYTHPLFDNFASFPGTHDVGIVVLSQPVNLETYGQLPQLGYLDALAARQSEQLLTVVGYGVQEVKPTPTDLLSRYKGTVMIVNLGSKTAGGFNIHMSSDGGIPHSGGFCFHDSGGPAFAGTSNIVVGTQSFISNANCKGSAYAYRMDIADSQGFITSFLR
jgi:hypothetical protein